MNEGACSIVEYVREYERFLDHSLYFFYHMLNDNFPRF